MTSEIFTKADLINFTPQHDSFVGIDSDGCVFDSMEIKQKNCFHRKTIEHWHLEEIEQYVREASEFATLYSQTRGLNRFLCLENSINLLRDRPEVIESGIKLPKLESLRNWIASGVPLGNASLIEEIAATDDDELKDILQWSLDVNTYITEEAKDMPLFTWAETCLEMITDTSDAIVVSQTPTDTIISDWERLNIRKYVEIIAGAELGSKSEHLHMATHGKYSENSVLIIGDAPGDEAAAKETGILFYPINPAKEEESWEAFHKEGYKRFLNHEFAGEYADKLSAEFNALLPSTPSWKQ